MGDFLVVEQNMGYYYGASRSDVVDTITKRIPSIMVTNVIDGFKRMRDFYLPTVLIFISPVEVDKSYSYDQRALQDVLSPRIERRKCLCPIKDLLQYCSREISALRHFEGIHIVHSPAGDKGFELSYVSLKRIIHQYAPLPSG